MAFLYRASRYDEHMYVYDYDDYHVVRKTRLFPGRPTSVHSSLNETDLHFYIIIIVIQYLLFLFRDLNFVMPRVFLYQHKIGLGNFSTTIDVFHETENYFQENSFISNERKLSWKSSKIEFCSKNPFDIYSKTKL